MNWPNRKPLRGPSAAYQQYENRGAEFLKELADDTAQRLVTNIPTDRCKYSQYILGALQAIVEITLGGGLSSNWENPEMVRALPGKVWSYLEKGTWGLKKERAKLSREMLGANSGDPNRAYTYALFEAQLQDALAASLASDEMEAAYIKVADAIRPKI